MQKKPVLKQPVLIASVAIVILLLIGGIALSRRAGGSAKASPSPSVNKKRINDPVNVIELSQRPYVRVLPKDAKNVSIQVVSLKKAATSMDYELEYQTESNLEGAIGELALTSLPAIKDVLLGSCSAGGACRYHKDVKGGTLLMRFSGGDQTFALKQDWKYIENTAKESVFSSRDAKFTAESKAFTKISIATIYNSPGLPGDVKGTPISDVYVLSPLEKVADKVTVSIRMTEDASTAKVMGWNGSSWQELETTVTDKMAKATNESFEAYVVVKK